MNNDAFAQQVYDMALACGYDDCGIIPIEDMDSFLPRWEDRVEKTPMSAPFYQQIAGLAKVRERFPWAKAMVVGTIWLGKYRMPEELRGKYGKAFVLSPSSDRTGPAYQNKLRFEQWLTDQGLRWDGGDKTGHVKVGALRHAAMMAGLGIIRKNNFFYTEKGSYVELEGYVIDRACQRKGTAQVKPCPAKCDLCMRACKTRSLSAPYTMNPVSCISFLSTFGGGRVPPMLPEAAFEQWVCGCDACQDACPFNRHDWDQGEDFPGLPELTDFLQPEQLLEASDQALLEKAVPKSADHVTPDNIEAFRRNSQRALRNRAAATKRAQG